MKHVFCSNGSRIDENSPRPSHLRCTIIGPSKWPVWQESERAISGPFSRQTTSRRRPAWLLYYRTWPVYGPPN